MQHVSMRDTFFLALLVLFSLVYSIPNIYPEYPAVEVKTTEISMPAIIETLEKNNITPSKVEDGTQAWLAFPNTDIQMQAKKIIAEQYPQTEPSLNLKRDLPHFLSYFGAKPMKLGLDLRGGVHLLLEVDTNSLERTLFEQNITSLKSSIPNIQEIRSASPTTRQVTLGYDAAHRDTIVKTIQRIGLEIQTIQPTEITIVMPLVETALQDTINAAVDQTIKSLDKRINELGIAEATVTRQGHNFISVDLPGIQDITRAKSLIGKTATLRFHLVADGKTEASAPVLQVPMRNMGIISIEKTPIITGDAIIVARAARDDQNHGTVVHIGIDPSREKSFYTHTSENIGRRMAVVYVETKNGVQTEEVISAPTIQSALGSQFQITGMRNYREAQDLSMLLRSGALAAPISVVEEATIGPSLGEDNIHKGIQSLSAASCLVFAFMAIYYRSYGVAANIGLIVNILLIIASLSILDATLTLPGIAGIVLTVGMAVDANVLINERIREELRDRVSLHKSIAMGYQRAFDTIFDSNMSTLLVAVILFGMGSGSIKGFAITLTIGILASLITSVYLTRYVTLLIAHGRTKLSHGLDFFSHNTTIPFMRLKNKAFILSIMLVCAAIASVMFYGITLGLDFTGGVEFRLQSEQPLQAEVIRDNLKTLGLGSASVQSVGGLHQFLVRAADINISVEKLTQNISKNFPHLTTTEIQIIGPHIGQELLHTAVWSVIMALLACACYIALRFEWRFAVAALVSLLHDPILILGMLALCGLEFNLITLAALLTVMGYSLNDTIVIYDRVRENFQKRHTITPEASIDLSINQTLSRTLLTSGLTLLVVLCLALLGGESLQGFSWALITGIIVGTYSSIYVAGTLSVQLGLCRDDLIRTRIKKPSVMV